MRRIKDSGSGVVVETEDGSTYKSDYVMVSTSIGVLQSNLIKFEPDLPVIIMIPSIFYTNFVELLSHQVSCSFTGVEDLGDLRVQHGCLHENPPQVSVQILAFRKWHRVFPLCKRQKGILSYLAGGFYTSLCP